MPGSNGRAFLSGTSEDGQRHRVVTAGAASPSVGKSWDLEGMIQNHPKYGRQVVTKKAVLVDA